MGSAKRKDGTGADVMLERAIFAFFQVFRHEIALNMWCISYGLCLIAVKYEPLN